MLEQRVSLFDVQLESRMLERLIDAEQLSATATAVPGDLSRAAKDLRS